MLTYSNLSKRFFRFSPKIFGLISKYFPLLSKGSFEPLLEDSESLPEAFLPQFEDLSGLFSRLSKAYFQELPSRFPKSCSLFSILIWDSIQRLFQVLTEELQPLFESFLPLLKGFTSPFQRLHKPPFKGFTSPFLKICNLFPEAFKPFSQRLPALLRASRSLFLAFSPYSLRRRGRFCGSGSGPRRSGRRRRVRSMLCCNCHSFILASWPESRMSGTFQPL